MYVKRTVDLNDMELLQITELYNNVFEKKVKVDDLFKKYYWTNSQGSYHAILQIGGVIVGSYSVIPYSYIHFNKCVTFGLSVDTMIDPNHRGSLSLLKKISGLAYSKLADDGVPFVFGFPNEKIYLVRKKILKWQDIGGLDYYILPIRIGKFRKSYRYFNIVTKLFCKYHVGITRLLRYRKELSHPKNIVNAELSSEYYITKRYPRNAYYTLNSNNYVAAYRISIEDGAKVAFIVEIFPMSKRNLEDVVYKVYNSNSKIDAIIYIGKLNFKIRNLFKVPERFIPKQLRMSGLILDKSIIGNEVYNIGNWQVNLGSYDVR
jgi:hypothetical protein